MSDKGEFMLVIVDRLGNSRPSVTSREARETLVEVDFGTHRRRREEEKKKHGTLAHSPPASC